MARKKPKESIFSYFRALFKENPHWLDLKSNDEIVTRYRADHNKSADEPIDKKVKDAMANVKSQMRKKLREEGGGAAAGPRTRGGRKAGAAGAPMMVALEEQIDDCLTLAKNLDRDGLSRVIGLLREARNEVVWKLGEPNGKS